MPPGLTPPIPTHFLDRMASWLGEEYPAFAAALETRPVNGLRVNTLKCSVEEFQKISLNELGEKVAWCDSAFVLPDSNFSFGRHPYHLAGMYYLQDPSAMATAQLLAPQPGERVLDLAAAPGGKATQMASLMQGRGLLVANEIKDKRLGHLAFNMERWGAGNVVVTNENPENLADHFGPYFDRVLVDAPCSGEGMFRKDMGARLDWSLEMVEGCSIRQRNILKVAAKLVRPGGYLLYSTCTFAPEEDEGAVSELINGPLNRQADKNGSSEFEVVELPLYEGFMRGKPEWLENGSKSNGLEGAVRLFPHKIKGEGHFICLLQRKKPNDWSLLSPSKKAKGNRSSSHLAVPSPVQMRLWKEFASDVLKIDFPEGRLRLRGERLYLAPEDMPEMGNLRLVHAGVWLGTFKKDRLEPAHPLALFLRSGHAQNVLDLPVDQAGGQDQLSRYLRGETLPSEGSAGWTLITAGGWPLGWGKRVQGVVKNHYPRGWQTYS